MSFDADLTSCAALVERADPLRFRSVMAAPVAARRVLFPLYAFNVEVARAPWVTQEPMIAEMRLQWWRDVCEEIAEGKPVRRHEVATPLAAAIGPDAATLLDELVAARRWDIYKDAFEDEAHFARYMDQTAGNLMVVAARALGTAEEGVLRDAAFAAGVAAWLRAIPELEARGRVPLLDGTMDGVAALAQTAMERLHKARASRALVSKAARPALMHVAQAEAVLRAAAQDPIAVADGRLPDPVEAGRMTFALRVVTGRW
ncbi:MAG: squalene/phytoene synthase family protein [Sulfitobacter sp.]